jgi:hypothetical protein
MVLQAVVVVLDTITVVHTHWEDLLVLQEELVKPVAVAVALAVMVAVITLVALLLVHSLVVLAVQVK